MVEAEVVTQRGLPPQATYTFKHALLQRKRHWRRRSDHEGRSKGTT